MYTAKCPHCKHSSDMSIFGLQIKVFLRDRNAIFLITCPHCGYVSRAKMAKDKFIELFPYWFSERS